MRKSTALTLGEASSKMSGYAALLNYKYLNLCVKAEPVSLLSVTVEYDDKSYNIEDVADVTGPREDQLQVYPKTPELTYYIGKAIALIHPEFKQEVVEEENDEATSEEEKEKSIILTMPKVNKDRRDALMDAVKAFYEEAKTNLTTNYEVYSQQVLFKLLDAPAEEIDEAKKSMEDIKKQNFELIDTYRDNKEKEIEAAYQRYLEKKTEKDKTLQEHEAATNKEATQGFKMPDTSDVEAPKVEAPKMETPKVEAPKVEAPKVDAPKPEAPKVNGFRMDSFKMPDAPGMPE